jgi:hypothetical protein
MKTVSDPVSFSVPMDGCGYLRSPTTLRRLMRLKHVFIAAGRLAMISGHKKRPSNCHWNRR